MNESLVYDTKGTSTDRVTSQNRLPTCYLVCGGLPNGYKNIIKNHNSNQS